MDIDGFKIKVLIQHSPRLGKVKNDSLSVPETLKGPKQVHFFYPNLEKFYKLKVKNYNEITIAIAWRQYLDQLTKLKTELWTEVHDIIQDAVIKTIPKKKKCQKQNGCLRRPYR